jgi:hypothetical protein
MESLGNRLLAGATTEVKVPRLIEFDVSIYSAATNRPCEEVLDHLRERGFVSANRPGNFEPRIFNVSGNPEKAIDLFSGLSKLDVMSAKTFSVSDGAQATVSATRSIPYTSRKTTETAPDGSTRVTHEEKSDLKVGVFLNLSAEAVVQKNDQVEMRCHRATTRPMYAPDVESGTNLPRAIQTSTATKCLLTPNDAFVHVEFLHAEKPTDSFSGETIVTVITARIADPKV